MKMLVKKWLSCSELFPHSNTIKQNFLLNLFSEITNVNFWEKKSIFVVKNYKIQKTRNKDNLNEKYPLTLSFVDKNCTLSIFIKKTKKVYLELNSSSSFTCLRVRIIIANGLSVL